MKFFAIALFLGGLLLGIRVMFFGVQQRVDEQRVALRRWPLSLATFLLTLGVMFYARATRGSELSVSWLVIALVVAVGGATAASWLVQRSAAMPSTDPEDDPQFRFQGQVARVTEDIRGTDGAPATGRIAFEFDGKRYEFRAQWTPGDWQSEQGRAESEVVIERVDDDLAYVEPWAAIEERL